MSWASFWVGVAAIPALAIAAALAALAVAWLAKGVAWVICKSARLRAHTDRSREAYASVILATTGDFVTLKLGNRIVIMFEVRGKTDTTAVKETWRKLRGMNEQILRPAPYGRSDI